MPGVDEPPIRVLHLGSPTGLYGAERWILALARHLPPEQVESFVAAIRDAADLEAPLCARAAELGFKTQVFDAPGRLSLAAVRPLRAFIHEHEIDVLHTHGYKTDIIAGLVVRGTGCRQVVTPHGWGGAPGLKLKVYEALDRLCLCGVDAVVPLSEALHAGLRRLPGMRSRLHLIPNGVDLDEIDAAAEAPAPLADWRTAGQTVIGYVGRLDAGKRIDTLLHAFARLDWPDKHLCIVGDGTARPQLERLAAELGLADHVVFLGFRADRLALLQAFDVFVLPSESEGIPRCLMEAMACRVTAVASDIPGCRHLVADGLTGLLFPVGDAVALARQLEALRADPDLRDRLATAGRDCIQRTHSAALMAERYLDLYRRLLGRPATQRVAGDAA